MKTPTPKKTRIHDNYIRGTYGKELPVAGAAPEKSSKKKSSKKKSSKIYVKLNSSPT